MAGETIGNGGCKCIYPFEKNYLKLGLEKLIEEENEKIEKVKEGAEDIRKSGLATPESLIEIHKRFLNDVETTKKRLETTPDCK